MTGHAFGVASRRPSWVPIVLLIAGAIGSGCNVALPAPPPTLQCDAPPDDDGAWDRTLAAETGCRWMGPPDYTYQPVIPLEGWTSWAPDLTNRSKVSMLVIGDFGCEDCVTPPSANTCGTDIGGTNVMVAEAAHAVCTETEYACDLAVLTGDNFYPRPGQSCSNVTTAGSDRWQTTWRGNFGRFAESEPDFRFWGSFGNHDYIEGNRLQAQIDYTRHPDNEGHLWMMPDRSYRIPRLPDWLRVWVVDSMPIVERPKWGDLGTSDPVERVATEMRAAEDTGWNVAVTHHPALSIGEGGVGANPDRSGFRCQLVLETSGARRAANTWAEAGMNMLVSGHEHDHQLHAGNGFLQVVEGTASRQRPCEFEPTDPRLFASDVLGFSILEFTASDLVVLYFDYTGALMPGGRMTYTREQVASLTQVLR